MSRLARLAIWSLFAGLAAAACAAEPFSAVYDRSTRVQRVDYKDNLVVQVAGFVNAPFFIELNPDEAITDVAMPEGAPYLMEKRGSRLFVRPQAAPKEPVTILVMTKSRSYVFDLVAGVKAGFKDRVSKIVFNYPAAVTQAPPAPQARVREIAVEAIAPPGPVLAGYRNDSYSMQVVSETVDIRPREAFDDGRFTFFKFPNNIEIPAIYKSTPASNEEWIVNSHKDGEYTVMHGVAQLWTFRLAGTVLGIFNDSYEPDGVAPKNGTTVSGLERAVKP